MAELNVGNLQMSITADGSAAIKEIDKVSQAAEQAGKAAEKAGSAGKASGAQAASGAQQAAGAYSQAGTAAQQAGTAARQAAEQSGAAWEKTAQTLQNVGSAMSKMITVPVIAAMTASVKGASDLTETLGKAEVVFDSMTDKVLEWSKTSVESMGLAQGSALDFASTYGDMATGMGLAIGPATEMSMSLTQLAADMASFKNISTDIAAQKLNAVFTGETEGLKSLGIVMTQTNLQAFALSQGMTKQVSEMSQAEQVMLRYQYVMNATKNAQGDFVRTGDSFANQTRKLGETINQAGESFGSLLLPVFTPVVEKIQGFVQMLSELDTGTKNMILSVAAVAAAIGPLLLIGGKLITFLSTLKVALAGLAINPVVLALAGLAAAVAGVIALKKALDNANGTIDNTDDKYEKLKKTIEGGAEGEVKITGDASGVLTAAAEAVQELLDSKYYGKLTIDGDPDKAQKVLQETKELIDKAKGTVTVNANGEKVIGDSGMISKIQAQIKELDAMVVITDDPKERALLIGRIADLKFKLSQLEGKVVITEDGKTLADVESERAALQDKLNELKARYKVEQDPANKVVLAQEIRNIQGQLDTLGAVIGFATGDSKQAIKDVRGQRDELQRELDQLKAQYEVEQDPINKIELEREIDSIQGQLDTLDAIIDIAAGDSDTALSDLQKRKGTLEEQLGALQLKLQMTEADSDEYKAVLEQIRSVQNELALIHAVEIAYNLPNTANLDAYMDKLEELGVKKTYTTTGQFVYTQETADLIQEYSDALANAALATGDYASAVENLNKVTDKRYGEKIQQVQEQANEKVDAIWREYNQALGTENEISESQVLDRVKQVGEDAINEIKRLEAERDAEKEANEVYNDGDRANDWEAYAMARKGIVDGQGMTQQDILNNQYRAANAVKEGNTDDIEAQRAAQNAFNSELANTATQLAQIQAAQAAYNDEIGKADEGLQTAQTAYDDQIASVEALQKAAELYINGFQDLGAEGAMQNVIDQNILDESQLAKFQEIMSGTGDGGLASYTEALGNIEMIAQYRQEADATLDAAKQKADEAKQAAADALLTTVQGVESLQGMTGTELQTSLDIAQQLGVTFSEAEQQAIVSGQNTITNLSNALQSGNVDIDSALTNAVGTLSGFQSALTTGVTTATDSAKTTAESGGKAVGENVDSGIIAGIAAKESSVLERARTLAKKAAQTIKDALEIKSPSRVMRDEVGRMIPEGIALGVEAGTPAALTSIRKSTSSLISGAAGVLSGRSFTAPSMAAAAPGINYGAMSDAMTDAMGKVSFGFSVGDVELAKATRDASSRQIALRANQISRGYGGK